MKINLINHTAFTCTPGSVPTLIAAGYSTVPRLGYTHRSQGTGNGVIKRNAAGLQRMSRRTIAAASKPHDGQPEFFEPARGKKLLTLGASLMLELALTGGVLWSPLLCALLFVIMTPSAAAQEEERERAIKHAVDQVRRDMQTRVPVTPPESAGWMNRMMSEIWVSYVVPQMLKENLGSWQEKVRRTAPSGWDIDLVDFSMGNEGPTMSNYQVFNNPATGRMTGLECDMVMDSSSMRVVVRGSGPLGSFTATVTGVTMKGRMRVLPIPEQRMLLWSYLEPPDATVKMQVRGPLIGEQQVPQFSFIKSAFTAAIQDTLVEPRRTAVSLDYEYLVQQAVGTNINLYIESINGMLPNEPIEQAANSLLASASTVLLSTAQLGKPQQKEDKTETATADNPAASGSVAATETALNGIVNDQITNKDTKGRDNNEASTSNESLLHLLNGNGKSEKAQDSTQQKDKSDKASEKQADGKLSLLANTRRRRPSVVVVATNKDSKVQRKTAVRLVGADGRVSLNELLKLELAGKDGILELQVRDTSRRRALLGKALVHVCATKDGCTLMWALGHHNEPLALRWQPAMGPWRITIPLENCPYGDASITLGLSADPWAYQAAQLPAAAYKTPGPRTVVLQVMEGRELVAKDWAGTSDPYVQISYSGTSFRTRTIYNSLRPVWGETFVFPENPSLLARRVKLDVWDNGVSRDESMGSASISLDLAIENAIQDRWVQLADEEAGELRIRLAVVPGTPESPVVQQMVALLSSNYSSASMSTLQVVVVGVRGLSPRSQMGILPTERNVYASITFAGVRQVTPVVHGDRTFAWNHSSLFPLSLKPQQQQEQNKELDLGSHPIDVTATESSWTSLDEDSQVTKSDRASITTNAGINKGSDKRTVISSESASQVSDSAQTDETKADSNSIGSGAAGKQADNGNRSETDNENENSPAPISMGRGAGSPRGWPQPSLPYPQRSTDDPLKPYPATPGKNQPARAHKDPEPPKAYLPCKLQVQVVDVDLVPPEDNLGSAEIDAALVVPNPGTIWEQWLPLKDGPTSGEVLIRLAHISATAAAQGPLPLPQLGQQQEETAGHAIVSTPAPAGVTTVSALSGDAEQSHPHSDKHEGEKGTGWVRSANMAAASTAKAGEDLRVKLRQAVVPKVQDWWTDVSQQAQTTVKDALQPLASAVSGVTAYGDKKQGRGKSPTDEKDKEQETDDDDNNDDNGKTGGGGGDQPRGVRKQQRPVKAGISKQKEQAVSKGQANAGVGSKPGGNAFSTPVGPFRFSSKGQMSQLNAKDRFWVTSNSTDSRNRSPQTGAEKENEEGVKPSPHYPHQTSQALSWLGSWLQGWPYTTPHPTRRQTNAQGSNKTDKSDASSGNLQEPAAVRSAAQVQNYPTGNEETNSATVGIPHTNSQSDYSIPKADTAGLPPATQQPDTAKLTGQKPEPGTSWAVVHPEQTSSNVGAVELTDTPSGTPAPCAASTPLAGADTGSFESR